MRWYIYRVTQLVMYIRFFSCYMFRPIFLAILRHMFVLHNCTYFYYYYLMKRYVQLYNANICLRMAKKIGRNM
jgi:hypothetical protein